MSIQDISLSNNQRKRLLKLANLESILYQDDNGDLVISSEAYKQFKKENTNQPLEDIIGEERLNFEAEYFVFS